MDENQRVVKIMKNKSDFKSKQELLLGALKKRREELDAIVCVAANYTKPVWALANEELNSVNLKIKTIQSRIDKYGASGIESIHVPQGTKMSY